MENIQLQYETLYTIAIVLFILYAGVMATIYFIRLHNQVNTLLRIANDPTRSDVSEGSKLHIRKIHIAKGSVDAPRLYRMTTQENLIGVPPACTKGTPLVGNGEKTAGFPF